MQVFSQPTNPVRTINVVPEISIMVTTSTHDLPYGPSAPLTEPAVGVHKGRRGNDLKTDSTASVLAIKEGRTAQGVLSEAATTRKEIASPSNGRRKTVESSNTQPHPSGIDAQERNSAHQAALRRLTGTSTVRRNSDAVDSSSSSSSQPVLVRTYSNPTADSGSSNPTKMEKRSKSRMKSRSYDLPPLQSFSFQDILASIDPEVRRSIDAIAEICGRSKLSLSDEYGSHRPPQGALTSQPEESDPANVLPAYLNPVPESLSQGPPNPDWRNSASLALVGTLNHGKVAIASVPIAATSNINSETYSESATHEVSDGSNPPPDEQSSILPHVLAWIRRSSASFTGSAEQGNQIERDPSAALHRILTKTKEKA